MGTLQHVDTFLLHGGQVPDTTTGARRFPLSAGPEPSYHGPDFIRLSIGIEHVGDILADIGQALGKSA